MAFMKKAKDLIFRLPALAVTALMLLSLYSCTSEGRISGYVYYRLPNDPTTLDPALLVDVNAGVIAAKMFMKIVPDIASDWTVSPNGLKYTFTLLKGVTFSSGRAVKASDFKFSFERVLDPATKSPNSWIFEHVKGADEYVSGAKNEVEGIRAVDDYTLVIILKNPFTPFLNLLTMPAAYVVPLEYVLLRGADFSSKPVGTGPFILKRWRPSRDITLQARQDYFEGPPKAKGIVYRVIPEELTTIAEFELGNLDIIPLPFSSFSRYAKSAKWKQYIASVEGLDTHYLGMNCSRPPFDNPELRRAINQAIDRKRILETLFEGRGKIATGPVPEQLRQWAAPKEYSYDPLAARKVIESLHLPDSPAQFYIPAQDQQVIDVSEVIQAYLKDAGLRVDIVKLEWSAFKEAVVEGKADMFWLSWWADYPDPENFLFPTFHSSNVGPGGNRARYVNEEVDRLIESGQHAPNREVRNSYYEKAERQIVTDAPWVFFWHRTDYTVRQPWVRNYRLFAVYTMDKGLEVSR
jgi:ABC-type transport system substrate-binding protein